jgi:neutral ceramidase
MKVILKTLKGLGIFIVLLLLILPFLLTTIDHTRVEQMPYYSDWKKEIGGLDVNNSDSSNALYIGWSKVNITPEKPRSMAGYGKRSFKQYQSVNDSVYIRAMYLTNGINKSYIVASDLLITPPSVVALLQQKLKATDISIDQVFFGATHTHSSVGGWGGKITGMLFAGEYDEQVVENLAEAMFNAIIQARQHPQETKVAYREAVDSVNVRNRLVGEEGIIDPEVRSIEFSTKNGAKLILATYAAHSTILSSSNMTLSRDFPGALVDTLEGKGYEFAMYMAGAVGSMAPQVQGSDDLDKIRNQVEGIDSAMFNPAAINNLQQNNLLFATTLKFPLREPTPRISANINLGLRPWVFRSLFGNYEPNIKVLRIGQILMVGVPADFSGELIPELDIYAKKKGFDLIVTSFNGGYIGYVTHDKYYNRDLYETVIMNWYGPYNGAYSQEVIKNIIDKFAH